MKLGPLTATKVKNDIHAIREDIQNIKLDIIQMLALLQREKLEKKSPGLARKSKET